MSATAAAATSNTTSSLLRLKLALLNGRATGAPEERFWTHPRLKEIFAEYLFLTHCVIRASVPILTAAEKEARRRAERGDEVCARLADYVAQHVEEEQNHDAWLLDDLEVLGYPRADVLKRVPPVAVAETAGAQYYWVNHVHPVAVLGYIAVLEGDPAREDEVEAAAARTGLPHDAFRTILMHAKLDPNHKQEMEEFLDSLPLTAEQQALVGVSAIATMSGMQRIMARLEQHGR
jgi:hypothetical protein